MCSSDLKPLDMGFVILCPDPSVGALRSTVNSVQRHYKSRCVAVVPADVNLEVYEGMSKVCPVYKGGDTMTSLADDPPYQRRS